MKSGISFHSSTLFTPSSIPQGKSMGSVKYSLMILKINKVWNGMKTMKMYSTYTGCPPKKRPLQEFSRILVQKCLSSPNMGILGPEHIYAI